MNPYYGHITKCHDIPIEFPPQYQPGQPGIESIMIPKPLSENHDHIGSGKLRGKVAIITGGDSGIGRAIAYLLKKVRISPSFTSMSTGTLWKRRNTSGNWAVDA